MLGFVLLLLFIFAIITFAIKERAHEQTSYYKQTGLSLREISSSRGSVGEFKLYHQLSYLENETHKILMNLYVPKKNKETVEIDMIYLAPDGLFVFECKNYSGWIFGNDTQKMWTQTLPGRWGVNKYHFYNPIWQNASHILALKQYIPTYIPIYSVIVFSDKCEFKNVMINRPNTIVTNLSMVNNEVINLGNHTECKISETDISNIYLQLSKYISIYQTGDMRRKHIEDVRKYK